MIDLGCLQTVTKYQITERLRQSYHVTEGRNIYTIDINLRPKSEDGEFAKRKNGVGEGKGVEAAG